MRILAYMVARNEAGRYLDACLDWATQFLDGIALFDDRSTDETTLLAELHGCEVKKNEGPSFLLHEGQFRQNAWRWFEASMRPEEGDWVLALDADEFLVATDGDERASLERVVDDAEASNSTSVCIPVPEVYYTDVEEDGLLFGAKIRTDGWWGKIQGTRLFKYVPGGRFGPKAMGCGAEPTYVQNGKIHRAPADLVLMHYGYADPVDVRAKYDRYTALYQHGHSDAHIRSIIQPPTLQDWPHREPVVWRGMKKRKL